VKTLPLYEYQCARCGRFERMQKFSDPILSECPTCGGPVEKLLSAPAIQFKGSGWYVTDYARKGSGKDAGSREGGGEAKDSGAGKDKAASGETGGAKDSSPSSTKPGEKK
jgi:putative FmdB family regulatory protein